MFPGAPNFYTGGVFRDPAGLATTGFPPRCATGGCPNFSAGQDWGNLNWYCAPCFQTYEQTHRGRGKAHWTNHRNGVFHVDPNMQSHNVGSIHQPVGPPDHSHQGNRKTVGQKKDRRNGGLVPGRPEQEAHRVRQKEEQLLRQQQQKKKQEETLLVKHKKKQEALTREAEQEAVRLIIQWNIALGQSLLGGRGSVVGNWIETPSSARVNDPRYSVSTGFALHAAFSLTLLLQHYPRIVALGMSFWRCSLFRWFKIKDFVDSEPWNIPLEGRGQFRLKSRAKRKEISKLIGAFGHLKTSDAAFSATARYDDKDWSPEHEFLRSAIEQDQKDVVNLLLKVKPALCKSQGFPNWCLEPAAENPCQLTALPMMRLLLENHRLQLKAMAMADVVSQALTYGTADVFRYLLEKGPHYVKMIEDVLTSQDTVSRLSTSEPAFMVQKLEYILPQLSLAKVGQMARVSQGRWNPLGGIINWHQEDRHWAREDRGNHYAHALALLLEFSLHGYCTPQEAMRAIEENTTENSCDMLLAIKRPEGSPSSGRGAINAPVADGKICLAKWSDVVTVLLKEGRNE